jgi:hypothetical protein
VPEEVMLVLIVLILTVGAVSILRPLSKRVGDLLEAMARDRGRHGPRPPVLESQNLRELLETMNNRLDRLEDRQDFTEALLGGSDASSRESRAPPPAPRQIAEGPAREKRIPESW